MGGHVCPWWLAYTFDNPLRRFFHSPEKMLGPYVAKGMTVLDIGCGMGFFSMGLARLVGDEGQVIAADVQEKMLKVLVKRADRAGISGRIHPHKCEPNQLGVESIVDFIVAFWMVHEVPDKKLFFHQARSCMKPKGKILIAEPKVHVSLKRFHAMLDSAKELGLNPSETPSIRFSRSVVLENYL